MFGIDRDSHNELRLLATFINASSLGQTHVARTNHGYHFRTELNCSLETAMQLRRMLGDDNKRVAVDELKIRHGLTEMVDTLFFGKLDDNWKWHYEQPVNVLALPFNLKVVHAKRTIGVRKNARHKRKHRSKR